MDGIEGYLQHKKVKMNNERGECWVIWFKRDEV